MILWSQKIKSTTRICRVIWMGNKSGDTVLNEAWAEIILNHFNKLYFSVLFNLTKKTTHVKRYLEQISGYLKDQILILSITESKLK